MKGRRYSKPKNQEGERQRGGKSVKEQRKSKNYLTQDREKGVSWIGPHGGS